MKTFYSRFFPFDEIYRWLSYGNVYTRYFAHREISYQLAGDVVIRFLSYKDADEFKQDVVKRLPQKIDIGAVYNIQPKDRKTVKSGQLIPMERELVFDIDMTEYDEVRTCCSKAEVCLKCWDFMTVAIKVIDKAMRDDFGFKHILWVYSGRRGVHCWVGDERARELTVTSRKAIVAYIEVVKGGASQVRKVNLPPGSRPLHPFLRSAEKAVIDPYFKHCILEKQKVMDTEAGREAILALIPDEAIRKELRNHFNGPKQQNDTSVERWEQLCEWVERSKAKSKNVSSAIRDIKFQYTYPRLDDKVTTGLNHLLKLPFCVHPGTGRVCVPIDPKTCEQFDPLNVPTVVSLIDELNSLHEDGSTMNIDGDEPIKDYMRTSLRPYIEHFTRFIEGYEFEVRETQRREAESELVVR
ncbi:hypothetical protein BJ742DRAFT_747943 [Cladochytrium replicatum]|nr:hypothetical protein BJ742DRAFT_747943 [Cladochytrium replicatum]